MKVFELIKIAQVLSSIKLNKIERSVAELILNNYDKIYPIIKNSVESIENVRKELVSLYGEESRKLEVYREEFKTTEEKSKPKILEKIQLECPNALRAEKEFAEFQNKILTEEIDIEITKINREVFVDACAESDFSITPADLMNLEYLFE